MNIDTILGRLKPWHSVVSLLAIYALMLAYSSTRHSPTWDEPGHLVAGLSHWKFGRFELYSVNPPLVRSIATLPVLFMDPPMDWSEFQSDPKLRSEVKLGRKFVELNGEKSLMYFWIARWSCIPLCLLGAITCYRWANQVYGTFAGWLSLCLWCFSPMLLGHGELITPDVGAAAIGLTATYCFRRWLLDSNWVNAGFAGIGLGLSFLSKSTLLVLFPTWCAVWVVTRLREIHAAPKAVIARSQLVHLVIMLLIAMVELNGFYAFRGTGTPLSEFRFQSKLFVGQSADADGQGNRFGSTTLGLMYVPLPRDFVVGIDVQMKDFERGYSERAWMSYWNESWQAGGWWYYYLAGFLVKEPIGIWLLLSLLIAMKLTKHASRLVSEDLILLIPMAGILLLVSCQTGMSRHLRYAIPAYPFLLIWISQIGRIFEPQCESTLPLKSFRPMRWAVGLSWSWFVLSSLSAYPHSISYFNEVARNTKSGVKWLAGSSLDWGQDLIRLQEWIDQHPDAKPLHLAYFGSIEPKWLGIDYRLPFPLPTDAALRPLSAQLSLGPQPGWYAISATILSGDLMPVPDSEGRFRYFGEPVFTYLSQEKPVDVIGNSIWVFRLSKSRTDDLRKQLGLAKLMP